MLIRFDAHFTYNCPRSILHMKPRGIVTSARPESDIEVLILKLGRHNARVGRCIVHTCKRHIILFSRKHTHTHTKKKTTTVFESFVSAKCKIVEAEVSARYKEPPPFPGSNHNHCNHNPTRQRFRSYCNLKFPSIEL